MEDIKNQNPEEPKNPEGNNPEGQEPKGETVTLSKEEYDRIRKDSEDKQGLVSEIKELREKKQLTESEKEELANKLKEYENKGGDRKDDEITPEKMMEMVDQQVNERLSKQQEEERKRNKETAISNFRNSHKEFHEDNDEGGLKWSAFEKKLAMFNLDSAYSVDEFTSMLNSAYALMDTKKETPAPSATGEGADSPSSEPVNVPTAGDEDKLSDEEKKLVKNSFDGDSKRYLEQKEKRPDYVSQLLTYQRMYNS